MPISDKHGLIFIHIPKNAGTAITSALQMYDIGHHNWQYYKEKYPEKWDRYIKICITRNPWERVVSCYEYAKMNNSYWHSKEYKSKFGKHPDYDLLREKTFQECLNILKSDCQKLRHQGWLNQSDYVYDCNNLVVNYAIDIKSIDVELSKILKTRIKINKINISNNKNYINYYKNNEMKCLVGKKYRVDILNFNYNLKNLIHI